MNELDILAKKYGTDKQIGNHGYTKYYDRHLKLLRDKPLNILEIGVHKGFSLQMWADYFPNSQIWGIDDGSSGDLCTQYDNPRIHFRQGRQNDPTFLNKLTEEAIEFNIIIDDGSHYSSDIVMTFKHLFNDYLRYGGLYIVEDLQCSYPPYTLPGLSQRFNSNNLTAVQFFKEYIDSINLSKDSPIESLSFYPQMCFVEKKGLC